MTDRKEDEAKLTEEEIDRQLIETLEDYSSPAYMNNTNEQEIERIKKEQEEIERIKKQKQEEREEFDRLLNELIRKELEETDLPSIEQMAHNPIPEYNNIKKEPEEFVELPLMEMASNYSLPAYNIKQEPVGHQFPDYNIKQEPVEFPDYNIKQEPIEFDDLPLIAMANDLDEIQNGSTINQEEQAENSKKSRYKLGFPPVTIPKRKRSAIAIPDLNPPELDPLQIAVEIVIKYHDFVDSTIEVLIEERGNVKIETRKWIRILGGGNRLLESVNPRLKRLGREMKRMAKDPNLRKEHAFIKVHVKEIMMQLRDVNAEIKGSVDLSLASDERYTEKVLPSCLKLLRRSREELSVLIQVIEELKVKNKDDEEDDDEYDGEILLSEYEES